MEQTQEETLNKLLKLFKNLDENTIRTTLMESNGNVATCIDKLLSLPLPQDQQNSNSTTTATTKKQLIGSIEYEFVEVAPKFVTVTKKKVVQPWGPLNINEVLSIDLLALIFTFVPKSSRIKVLQTCKLWKMAGRRAFDPSRNGNWAIRWAAMNGYVSLVKELLSDVRVNPADSMSDALRWACLNGKNLLQYE